MTAALKCRLNSENPACNTAGFLRSQGPLFMDGIGCIFPPVAEAPLKLRVCAMPLVTLVLGTVLASQSTPAQLSKAPSTRPSLPTGLLYDDIYLRHLSGNTGHPERPERLISIHDGLDKAGLLQKLYPIHPRRVTQDELELVHKPSYIALVRRELSSVQGTRELSTGDTLVSKDSLEAAEFAAGGVLNVVDAVMQGKVKNAFAAVNWSAEIQTAE